jgi:diguanylate cyclase (GGDEF)-like protein
VFPDAGTASTSTDSFSIDHLKHLNDRYRHGAGDICLKRVAAVLLAELRKTGDWPSDTAGEEFLLLLPGMEIMDAVRLAGRIRRSIEGAAIPDDGAGFRGIVTASFGAVTSSASDLSSLELIAAADQALYAAKSKGRNQVWPPFVANVSKPSARMLIEPAAFATLSQNGTQSI